MTITAPAGPTQSPPEAETRSGALGTTTPLEEIESRLAAVALASSAAALAAQETRPALEPPPGGTTARAVGGARAATWRSGQVVALWSIDEVRNGWINLSGVGWRKLYNGRDFAYLQLMSLAGQARQTGATIAAREEADGMIYEIYLW